MKINEAFSARLEQYLTARNSSIFKFTKEAGIARSTIVNLFEGNSKSPTLATLYQVCDALQVSVFEFLNCELFRRENIDIE